MRWTAFSFFVLAVVLSLAPSGAARASETAVRAAVESLAPGTVIDRIEASPMPGFYLVVIGADVVHVSEDARFLIQGPVYDIPNKVDLVDASRAQERRLLLQAIPDDHLVSFAPAQVARRITVFTDIDCGYCRKLHEHVPELNAAGVAVDYVLYPRAGVGSTSFDSAVSVFCSDDRQKALTDAKAGRAIPKVLCASTVAEDIALGKQLRIQGTPAIFDDAGRQLGGYLSTADLLARLDLD